MGEKRFRVQPTEQGGEAWMALQLAGWLLLVPALLMVVVSLDEQLFIFGAILLAIGVITLVVGKLLERRHYH